ncbi:phage portal protein [Actinosynnema sp. ALI-1.44]|uniref:phage portal protein n=1 Tax=Actinosynnema sp. ALI-1.44 TaxID=1933779 RepID=UPI00097CB99D|nr:phage portal protein [Actinosynnema sp. ALI-1.44]ONI73087.1 phage portal protein [Actinosynnema sp. ALI-1.44]
MWPFRRRKPTASTISISDPLLIEKLFGGRHSLAGVTVTENTALGISAFFRAGSLICGTLAGLPIRALRINKADDTRQRATSWLEEPAGPGSYTQFEWTEVVSWHLFLHGNAYLLHRYNGAGSLVGLYPVHPLAVTPQWIKDKNGTDTSQKEFLVSLGKSPFGKAQSVTYDETRMTQIMGPTLDGLRGLSVLGLARNGLGTSIASDNAAAKMFGNGLSVSGMVTPEEDVTPDEAKTIKDDLNAKLTGPENAGEIAVINRKLKFQQLSLSAEDAQFLQSRQFQVQEIARWTGVPSNLLMDPGAVSTWGTGVEIQNRGLHRYTLTAYTGRIEQRLTRLLPKPQIAEFDYTAFLRPSPEQEIELLIKQVDAGLLSINDARRIRNMPPVDGGDVVRVRGVPITASPKEGAAAA